MESESDLVLGPLKRIFHWGPIIALTIISVVAYATLVCVLQWWPPITVGGILHLFMYGTWVFLTLYNLLNAAFIGPGVLPLRWQPRREKDKNYLQFCTFCEGYKAPRSHHCRKCGRCVMKMDHHCPWINNCVGHRNHAYFTFFLLFAPIGCIHSICILIPSLYRAVNRNLYILSGSAASGIPIVNLGIYSFILSMFAIGMAVGVTVAVGGLCFIQCRTILRNETGIESWIKEKAEYRDREDDEEEFVYPYNLGRIENWKLVFGIKPRPELDGIWWPVRDGCTQYSITIEQIKQKKEKKERSVLYNAVDDFSGAFFPVTKGLKVFCCIPFSDEPRIPFKVGQKVLVTRWKKHWLYGDVLDENLDIGKGSNRIRGWFPRRCVVEDMANNIIQSDEDEGNSGEKKKEN